MATTIEELERLRAGLKTRIVQTQNRINNFDKTPPSINEIELATQDLKDHQEDVKELYNQCLLLLTEEELWAAGKQPAVGQPAGPSHQQTFDTMFSAVRNLTLKVMDHRRAQPVSSPNAAPSFKLERIKLPQFDGSYSEWQAFRDLFLTSVHRNPTLSNAEKLIHLKSCLIGRAASIISAFQATDANYPVAWTAVEKRFNVPREVIMSHLKKFDDFKPIDSESGAQLRKLADTVNECVQSLKVMKVLVEHWDLILIFYSVKKLDQDTKKEWSLHQKDTPTLKEFLEFLEIRARALTDSTPNPSKSKSEGRDKKNSSFSHHSAGESTKSHSCLKCSDAHSLFRCPSFNSLPLHERKNFAHNKKLCMNCLYRGHTAAQCKGKFNCQKCGKRHNTLLHYDSAPASSSAEETKETADDEDSSHCSPDLQSSHVVLFATLVATTDDCNGEKQNVRVFLDTGSGPNFISENCINRLGLKRKPACVSINGIGNTFAQTAKGFVNLKLFSKVRNFQLPVDCLVLPKISGNLPRSSTKKSWPHIRKIELSDPLFHKAGPVDILLGAKHSAAILLPGLVQGPVGTPTAQNTQYGWILTGPAASLDSHSSHGAASKHSPPTHFTASTHHAACNLESPCSDATRKHSLKNLDSSLQRFWELEEGESESCSSEEEVKCEEHFKATHVRNSDGTYTVELPFKDGAQSLGHSKAGATKRFNRVESRLLQDPALHTQYKQVMQETLASGFMERVPPEELAKSPSETYYMPHRGVIKEGSSTTKLRVVFDASSKTSSGYSLNDILMTGPKLQTDLVSLLIRFRCHAVAVSADITKFYHQIRMDPKHKDFQRLLWRNSPEDPIQDYRMTRVTFGVTSAPFLAIRCLNQLASDEGSSFPLAAAALQNDFLVDNLLTGAQDIDSAITLQQQILQVMDNGKLKLTKWSSNEPRMMESIPICDRESHSLLPINESEVIKTIGILWKPHPDSFSLSIIPPNLQLGSSKRKVLSSIARIFDPLGWLSPFTIQFKILLQELWREKLDWDSPLPGHLHQTWTSLCQQLPTLERFQLGRKILLNPQSSYSATYEIHGFCDASIHAYSAVVYIRTVGERESYVNLVLAKTKVSPIRPETIPRLELCGAVLLSKLIQTVMGSVKIKFTSVRCWTDSTIVLDWLQSTSKLPIFVLNRVRKISAIVPRVHWAHTPGVDNPADPPSRGISATSLVNNKTWLHGPEWLPSLKIEADPTSLTTSLASGSSLENLVSSCSSFTKMRRVVAQCLRFLHNLRVKPEERRNGFLRVDELNSALNHIVIIIQADSFPEEISNLKRKAAQSKIKQLAPFLDPQGILRVGGRLQLSSLPYPAQHPILLPKNHNFSIQVVRHLHLTHLHAGPQLLVAITRQQFWIPRAADLAKKIVRSCVVCHRNNTRTSSQLMGPLPTSRVTPSRPFSNSGVDFAGPFRLSLRTGRKPPIIKAYVSLFVCMATKAIHLEMVTDLTTAAFTAALSRFIARRGKPSDIFSDGGTNFVGARNEMKEMRQFLKSSSNQISQFLAADLINYRFNPASAPHFGGLWEAGVKSMKTHLRRVVGDRLMTTEEFTTLLCQVESCLNSRPLTQMSSDPNDFAALTPGHFLTGAALTSPPQHDLTQLNPGRLDRWQLVQQMSRHFWNRWKSEYLGRLQSRPKWTDQLPNLQIGTLVLICDDDPAFGPLKWKLGRISGVHPGSDGNIRVCDVTIANGSVLRRPIVKLSPLPIYDK